MFFIQNNIEWDHCSIEKGYMCSSALYEVVKETSNIVSGERYIIKTYKV